uniref:Uncharacterized protein n=1 Tax=Ciona savignyi TaxID=51511 RepID=H2ZF37_CIOSA
MSQRRIKHDRDDAQVYVYPVPPNKTDLFTKYRYIERPRTAAVSYLDHILAKTSLTTQKATHANIESVGHQIYEAKVLKFQQEKADAVVNAVLETKTKTQQEADKVLAKALDKARIEKQAA